MIIPVVQVYPALWGQNVPTKMLIVWYRRICSSYLRREKHISFVQKNMQFGAVANMFGQNVR